MVEMNPQLREDVVHRLVDQFEFKPKGKYLQEGRCPECNKRELFVSAESPWMVKCGRENKCGAQFHVKELFGDLFDDWSKRYGREDSPARQSEPASSTPVADAYLKYGRGFDLKLIAGWYTQEHYYDPQLDAGTATVRFPLVDGFWERLIDKPARFGKKKARIKWGTKYQGLWWEPNGMEPAAADELWIVEGIFDAIALMHVGIQAVAAISCNNYPGDALDQLSRRCAERGTPRPRLVWALDGDGAGRKYTLKHVGLARKAGWECEAAQIPQTGKAKHDWNDCWQSGRLSERDLERYRYEGAILIADTALEKALLMYQRTERREFPFRFRDRCYWFKLDMAAYERAAKEMAGDGEGRLDEEERNEALRQAGTVREIANCWPQALYYQANRITDESWYYFRVDFPHDGAPVKNAFSSGQLSASSEFKKRLMGIAPGAIWEGETKHLDKLLREQISNIKTVETIDFIGYSREHGTYVFGDVAVKDGQIVELNDQDYFELGKLSLKTLSQSVALSINADRNEYRQDWPQLLWHAYGAKGIVALAFWLGALFAEQIRERAKSFPFLEIVGEAGSGKSTLIEFLWKLVGRRDYEGFDPSKSTAAGRARNFTQVSNLPVVLIESDRDQDGGAKQRQFDWDELKTTYNGRSLRSRGHKNQGNDTYEPPFRGAIVISQNAAVDASDAIMQRILHLRFTRETQTAETKRTAEQLERMPIEELSGFALQAVVREKALLELFDRQAPVHETAIAGISEIRSVRVAKNHGQLMALIECLGPAGLNLIKQDHVNEALDHAEQMAIQRQVAINADHPVVQEFWEAFDHLENLQGGTVLNHYRVDRPEVAINLKHFESLAADHKLRVPPTSEIKRHLKSSKCRQFVEANRSVRSNLWDERTVKCWIFKKETEE